MSSDPGSGEAFVRENEDTASSRTIMGLGGTVMIIGLGVLGVHGLLTGHLNAGWQPVPDQLPMLALLTTAHSCTLRAAAMAALTGWHRRQSLLVLFSFSLLWLLLHVPGVVSAPESVVQWLGAAELGAVSASLWLLISRTPGKLADFRRSRRVGLAYGMCALVFGASHFAYGKFTASMVPLRLGHGLFWAYVTGSAHLAAGLAMLTGRLVRVATVLLAIMMGSFVLLVHVPRVLASSGDATEVGFLI